MLNLKDISKFLGCELPEMGLATFDQIVKELLKQNHKQYHFIPARVTPNRSQTNTASSILSNINVQKMSLNCPKCFLHSSLLCEESLYDLPKCFYPIRAFHNHECS